MSTYRIFIVCRVEGRGPATIAEVAFRTKYLTSEEQNNVKEEKDKIRKKLEDAKRSRDVLDHKHKRLEKQRNVLDGFADNAIKGSGIPVTLLYLYCSFVSVILGKPNVHLMVYI